MNGDAQGHGTFVDVTDLALKGLDAVTIGGNICFHDFELGLEVVHGHKEVGHHAKHALLEVSVTDLLVGVEVSAHRVDTSSRHVDLAQCLGGERGKAVEVWSPIMFLPSLAGFALPRSSLVLAGKFDSTMGSGARHPRRQG